MIRYSYRYETVDCFDTNIYCHHFKLRCVPYECDFQHLSEHHLHISPCNKVTFGFDAFGNGIQYGGEAEPHNFFAFVSRGIVEQQTYRIREAAYPSSIYLLPTMSTAASKGMLYMIDTSSLPDDGEKALRLCHAVNRWMSYKPGVTDVGTTAAEAFEAGAGVCQDYAHILIALCRAAGIPARYVNGFLIGNGETHAWVEVYHDGCWEGLDPTNDCRIEYGYIKVAHGRDANDCPVNRGVFTGHALQHSTIQVSVEEMTSGNIIQKS